jgi:hypothetical protein
MSDLNSCIVGEESGDENYERESLFRSRRSSLQITEK